MTSRLDDEERRLRDQMSSMLGLLPPQNSHPMQHMLEHDIGVQQVDQPMGRVGQSVSDLDSYIRMCVFKCVHACSCCQFTTICRLTSRQAPLKKLPMMLLAVVISTQRALVRSAAPFPPRVPRGFANASVYDMPLTRTEHLRVVNWGLHCKVMRLLSLGISRVSEMPAQNVMQRMVGRVAAGLAAAARHKIFEQANELCTSGRRVDGALLLQQAIDLGHLPSRALKAWMECEEYNKHDRSVSIPRDVDGDPIYSVSKKTQKLVEEGALWGCRDCQGVLAWLIHIEAEISDEEEQTEKYPKSLELALQSSEKGSKYGQFVLGYFNEDYNSSGVPMEKNMVRSCEWYRLASSQGHDGATYKLAEFYAGADEETIFAVFGELDVETLNAEALRLYILAVAQGYQNPDVLRHIAEFVNHTGNEGFVVSKNKAEAIRRLMCAKPGPFGALCPHDNDTLKKLLDAQSQE